MTPLCPVARRRDLGQDGQGLARTHARSRGARAHPRAAGIDSQSVKTTAMGALSGGMTGGKKIQGRQRHLLVATLGWLLAVLITRAGLDDGVAAPLLLSHVPPYHLPRLVTIFADQQYHHQALDAWIGAHRTGGRREVQERPAGITGCTAGETRGDCAHARVAWAVAAQE